MRGRKAGNIFIADADNSRIREVVAKTGVIQTIAGNGTFGYSGDGGSALKAELSVPFGVYVDGSGNIFIADSTNNRIREVVAKTGIIQTVAGNGTLGFSCDGGLATKAALAFPLGLAVDSVSDILFADQQSGRIRKLVPTDFQLAANPTAMTISAGQTVSFNLAITPVGSFTGTVNLGYTITPAVTPAPMCTLPASVNVTAGKAASVTVKVSTTVAGAAGSLSLVDFPPRTTPFVSAMVLLAFGLLFVGHRRRVPALAVPMIVVVFLAMAGCGSSGGGSGPPTGIYTATVTGTSGSLSHSIPPTIVVK